MTLRQKRQSIDVGDLGKNADKAKIGTYGWPQAIESRIAALKQ